MHRPLLRWVRSLLAVSGMATVVFALIGLPAGAAGTVSGTIAAGSSGLSVRTGATTLSQRTGTLPTGTTITIQCQVAGQSIRGRVRTTDRWNRLADGRYVSDAYVSRSASVATCAADTPATAQPVSTGTVGGTVQAGSSGLSVRTGATTSSQRTGKFPTGTTITIQCQVAGQSIRGRVRTTDRWNRLADGRYVSDAYVSRSASVTTCPVGTPASTPSSSAYPPVKGGTPIGRWVVPVPSKTVQGFRTAARPNHDGEDFMARRWTPIRSTAAGTVVTVTCNTSGLNCDVDGSTAIRGCGWYVEVRHEGDIVTRYCHMVSRPPVGVGEQVSAGQIIGEVGSSGRSSGPHLHFEIHTGYPATRANAVDPIDFMQRAGAPIA